MTFYPLFWLCLALFGLVARHSFHNSCYYYHLRVRLLGQPEPEFHIAPPWQVWHLNKRYYIIYYRASSKKWLLHSKCHGVAESSIACYFQFEHWTFKLYTESQTLIYLVPRWLFFADDTVFVLPDDTHHFYTMGLRRHITGCFPFIMKSLVVRLFIVCMSSIDKVGCVYIHAMRQNQLARGEKFIDTSVQY